MSITEQQRHDLYNALEALIGSTPASTLMEHLPPVGWADVATKRDLDHLEAVIEAKFDARMSDLRADISEKMRIQAFSIVGANATLLAVAVGVGRLF